MFKILLFIILPLQKDNTFYFSKLFLFLPSGPMCGCNKGYTLSNDSKTCVDVNECDDDIEVCTHQCHNTKGSYICKCGPGFTLRPDRVTCSAGGTETLITF